MEWKHKKILVTGGAGVIGRELIENLVSLGSNILCIDRQSKPQNMASSVEYYKVDISEMKDRTIINFNPEIIFHLAASFERTEETPEFWEVNFRDNITVSHKIYNIAKNLPALKKFIFASSYLIYSPSLYLFDNFQASPKKLDENGQLSTRNLTGAAKYYNEKELEFVNSMFGEFIFICARIFRVYGRGSRDIISRWIRMAINNEELIVYNKENIFDYIFSGDVANGLIRLAENAKENDIANLGSGTGRKVEEVLKIIQSEIPNVKYSFMKNEGHYEASCADILKLINLTNWQPQIKLEDGIRKIFNYERGLLGLKAINA